MKIKMREVKAVQEGFDQVRKPTFLNRLYKQVAPLTRGFYSDQSWQGVKKVWDIFNKLGLDWNIIDSYYGDGKYDKTVPPERKTWKFEIKFNNERGRSNKIYGVLKAAGAGSVSDPLSRYDITVSMG